VGAEYLASRPLEDGGIEVHVRLKVVPGASRAGLAGAYGDRLKVRVTAPPASGQANRALLALLSEVLGVAPATLRLVRGAGTPLKTVAVTGLQAAEVARRLEGGTA
jgi:hypothetical protein